jgi:hypothetical protein
MRMPRMSAHHKKLNSRAKQKQSNSSFYMLQSQRPREAKNNRDQKSHACAPLTVVRAAPTVFKRYHSPLYGSHVKFEIRKLELQCM